MLPAPILPFIRVADFAVRKPWRTDQRRLLDYLLIYVQEGRCVVTLSDTSYDVPPGHFCLIQPDELHTLDGVTNTITPFAHFDIFYNAQREESFVTRPIHTDLTALRHLLQPRLNDIPAVKIPVVFGSSEPEQFRTIMLKMIGLWQQRDALSQFHAQHLATGLVLTLLQDFSRLANAQISQPQALNWITAFLSFHMAEPLTVADMARRAQLSPSHFTALFRQTFGTSPHRYLTQLRVQRAQELLRSSRHSAQHIADECGFADVQHFSKAFKQIAGVSPRAYRAGAAPHLGR